MKGARANWTEDSRAAFIHAMVAEIRRGSYVDSGFKMAGWGQIVKDLNTQTGGSFSKQQCQSLYPKLKADWIAYSAIIGNSGFGIDPETLAPTAPKSVWDTLIVAHPLAAQFRYKALKHFDELDIVFYGSSATGKFAKSPFSQVTPSQKHSRDNGETSEEGEKSRKESKNARKAAKYDSSSENERENEEPAARPQLKRSQGEDNSSEEEQQQIRKSPAAVAANYRSQARKHADEDSSSEEEQSIKKEPAVKYRPQARKPADEDRSSEEEQVKKKQVPVKPLPVKTQARKPRENVQEEVAKLLGKIVSNQEILVKHHTADSFLTRAMYLFKEKHSANLSAAERVKFHRYLRDNAESFLQMDDEEIEACIADCLNY